MSINESDINSPDKNLTQDNFKAFRFNRMELAGSLGDLGTILPLAIGMILINGLSPASIFFCVAVFYIFSGFYFKLTSPVEPMKVIAAYAIATGVTATQIQASCLLTFIILLFFGATGLISLISRYVPRPVVRGVQLSTGLLLVTQGVKLMMGTTKFQELSSAAEPYLSVQSLGPLPLGLVIGGFLGVLTLLMLDNKRVPAALIVVGTGVLVGILLGTKEGMAELVPGFHLPDLFPYGFPSGPDYSFALLMLVMPQIPMTLGNAVIATNDLYKHYFPKENKMVTPRSLTLSMSAANLISYIFGGMPMCHGAGGLASRYCFGARTAGSNLIIGVIFILLALLLGGGILSIINLIPLSALGVLLIFAGMQLALTILDIKTRKDLFVPVLIVSITLASNLAIGFITGIIIAYVLKSERLKI
jgi:sulfate permease, SulP family